MNVEVRTAVGWMQHLENVRGYSVIITPVIDTNVMQIVDFAYSKRVEMKKASLKFIIASYYRYYIVITLL